MPPAVVIEAVPGVETSPTDTFAEKSGPCRIDETEVTERRHAIERGDVVVGI